MAVAGTVLRTVSFDARHMTFETSCLILVKLPLAMTSPAATMVKRAKIHGNTGGRARKGCRSKPVPRRHRVSR